MVENVACVVNVKKVLGRLSDRCLQIVLKVGQHVLQEVGMRLHISVKDDDNVIVPWLLLCKDVELQA